jgi:hypothetical protein
MTDLGKVTLNVIVGMISIGGGACRKDVIPMSQGEPGTGWRSLRYKEAATGALIGAGVGVVGWLLGLTFH